MQQSEILERWLEFEFYTVKEETFFGFHPAPLESLVELENNVGLSLLHYWRKFGSQGKEVKVFFPTGS